MTDYLLLMHNDATEPGPYDWETYIARLIAHGGFDGGSAIAGGECVRKSGAVPAVNDQLGGYMRIQAESLDAVKALLAGNPIFEAGGTVEIRELPRS